MKYDINLYYDQFKPHFIWMTLSHLFSFCVLVILATGLAVAVLDQELYHLDKQSLEVQQSLNQQKVVIDEMADALTKRSQSPALIESLDKLKSNIQGKEALLQHIDTLSELQTHSFSEMLSALAKVDPNSLWLTRIQVVENDLNLQGVIASPDALPLWIKSLSDTQYFAKRNFSNASIRLDKEQLVFNLATQKEEVVGAN